MKSLSEKALDLLYPPKCVFCRRLTEDESFLCPQCEEKLPRPERALEWREIPPLDGCLAPLYYEDDVREALHRYKFHGATSSAAVFAGLMADCLQQHSVTADCITWVPLSRKRLKKRGYDQAELLARELSRRTGIPCLRLLKKTRHNPAQSGRASAAERRRNVEGVYEATLLQPGLRLLLTDDIVTTGATLASAAGTLLSAGAAGVTGICVARPRFRREPGILGNGEWDYADL